MIISIGLLIVCYALLYHIGNVLTGIIGGKHAVAQRIVFRIVRYVILFVHTHFQHSCAGTLVPVGLHLHAFLFVLSLLMVFRYYP